MREQRALEQIAVGARVGQRVQRWGRGMAGLARRQPLGAGSVVVLVAAVLMAALASVISPYGPLDVAPKEALAAPSASHWFGTDNYGRDMLSRIIHGAGISLQVGFFAVAIGTSIGYLLGVTSGYVGGLFDLLVQRFVDALQAFPGILLALTLVGVLGAGLDKVIFAISVGFVAGPSRIARGTVLSVKQNVYVEAAKVIGASQRRIMLRHVLPNSMAPWLIIASAQLGGAILAEASLSFLGLGVPPPAVSWGRMLSGAAQTYAGVAPWLVIFPGAAIMLMVLAFNLFGDALRDVWDPRLRGR